MVFATAEEKHAADKSQDSGYILQPNDTLKLDVYEEPDLTCSVRILKTGEASFPLIGSLKISGLSVSAAASKIRELYAKDYLADPKLTLTVSDYSTQYITVVGAVMTPGQIPIPVSGDLDLVSVMARAGGLAANADANAILLARASGTTSRFSMAEIQSGNAGRIKLGAGDRITVSQSIYVGKTITILGQVRTPGPLPFPVDGRLDLVKAVAMAGGLTDLANPRKITINRKGKISVVDYKAISQQGDQPLLLQPDDILTVAERIF